MLYSEIDQRLSELIKRSVDAQLVHWRVIRIDEQEAEFIVLWRRKSKDWGDDGRTEFGVHRAYLGFDGKAEGLSDLILGDYFFDFDKAIKRFKSR